MDEEKIKVSKSLLKTLTVDTRTDILKCLGNRQMTASELSRKLDKHVTTISEHLQNLKDSDLVERIERPGRKWVYYRLTKPGKDIIRPESHRWVFIISVTFICFIGGFYFATANSYPGDSLYGLKRTIEDLQLTITGDSLQRAQLHIYRANERLEETKELVQRGQTGYVPAIIKDYNKDITQARIEIQKSKQSEINVVPVLETLSESTAKQTAMLKNIAIKSPNVAGQIKPALNISEQEHATAVEELTGIAKKK